MVYGAFQTLGGRRRFHSRTNHGGQATALPFIGAFIANLVLAYVLAWLVARTGETSATRGAKLGALLWVGLVATTMGTEIAFELRSLQFFLITAGYPLVGLLLMGAIVGGWRKKVA